MSGLAVLASRDGRPVQEGDAWAMLRAIPYRGPDGMNVRSWPGQGVVLGHAKMIATPEDTDDCQPLVSPRTGCAIIADVRLDNREHLIDRLGHGAQVSLSDAEIILRAYEAWGVEMLPRLLGDFAFVVWDPRSRQLVCARDTSGQRELYYRLDRHTFAAASEIHQLLQDPSVPMRPNRDRILDSLVPLNAFMNEKDRPDTYFEGISAVPAGHVLVVGPDGDRLEQYWELVPGKEIRYRRHAEYAEHFRALFFDVVRTRLRNVGPAAALLSGGLDSSSVVCSARTLAHEGRVEDQGFVGITATFDGLNCDEQPLVDEIRRMYDLDIRLVPAGDHAGRLSVEPRGFLPGPDMGIPAVRDAMFSEVHRSGARMVMTGDIADACVYGSRAVFHSLLRRLRPREFVLHWRSYRRAVSESVPGMLFHGCLWPLLPTRIQARAMAPYIAWFARRNDHRVVPWWLNGPVHEEVRRRHWDMWRQQSVGRRFSDVGRETDRSALYPPALARHPSPWPVEIRRPFADRRLHEFLLSVPPEEKFSPHPDTDEFYAGSKRLLRTAMLGILPEAIRTRTSKTVFTASVRSELEYQWPVLETVFGPGGRAETAEYGLIDQERFWGRLQELRTDSSNPETLYAMHIVNLENWLRLFRLERGRATTVAQPSHTGEGSSRRNEDLVAS